MKKVLLMLFAVLIFPVANGEVITEVDMGDDYIQIETDLILLSDNNIDVWNLEWTLPEGGELITIEDETGPITDYTIEGNSIEFKTNADIDRNREDVRIVSRVENPYDESYLPFKRLELSIPGFENDKSTLTINGNMITTSIPTGFDVMVSRNRIVMQGEGPIAIIGYLGDVTKSEYFYHHGNGEIEEAEDNINLIAGTIGMVPYYIEFPILFVGEDEYDVQLSDFSAGTYKTGGIIIVREGDDNADTILHETVHAYNDQIMNWRSTSVGWFDEGTAQYVEYLYRLKVGDHSPEVFGDSISYREGLTVYTLPPKGDIDDLWNYYQSGDDFMESWGAYDSPSEIREFGYAYSELLIRKYVMDKGPEALHDAYRELSKIDHNVDSNDEFNEIVLGIMGTDMRPCYSDNREEFESCIEDVNDFTPIILEFNSDLSTARRNDAIGSTDSFRDIETSKKEGLVEESFLDKILLFMRDLSIKINEFLLSLSQE